MAKLYRQMALLSSLGTGFALLAAGGFLLGSYLDEVTGWRPALTLAFGLTGIAAAFLHLIRTVSKLNGDDDS